MIELTAFEPLPANFHLIHRYDPNHMSLPPLYLLILLPGSFPFQYHNSPKSSMNPVSIGVGSNGPGSLGVPRLTNQAASQLVSYKNTHLKKCFFHFSTRVNF